MPRITVAPHTPALAEDFNAVSDQSIMVFGTAAQRTAAIPTPTLGMHTFRTDASMLEMWDGTAWARVPNRAQALYQSSLAGGSITTTLAWLGHATVPNLAYPYRCLALASLTLSGGLAAGQHGDMQIRYNTTGAAPAFGDTLRRQTRWMGGGTSQNSAVAHATIDRPSGPLTVGVFAVVSAGAVPISGSADVTANQIELLVTPT